MRTRFDIGEIIRCHGGEFLGKHNVVAPVRRAFTHMALCRTSALGGLSRVRGYAYQLQQLS